MRAALLQMPAMITDILFQATFAAGATLLHQATPTLCKYCRPIFHFRIDRVGAFMPHTAFDAQRMLTVLTALCKITIAVLCEIPTAFWLLALLAFGSTVPVQTWNLILGHVECGIGGVVFPIIVLI